MRGTPPRCRSASSSRRTPYWWCSPTSCCPGDRATWTWWTRSSSSCCSAFSPASTTATAPSPTIAPPPLTGQEPDADTPGTERDHAAAGADVPGPVRRHLRGPARCRPGDGHRIQALTALIPLLLLVSTFAPDNRRDVVAQGLVRRFQLTGNAAQAVTEVFTRPASGSSIGVLSVLILVISAVSLARRLQRLYQDAWRLGPVGGVRGSLTTFVGLGALLLQIALLYLARSLLRTVPLNWLLSVTVSLVTGVVLWICIPW